MSDIHVICGNLSQTPKPTEEDLKRIAPILGDWNNVPDEEIAWVKSTLKIPNGCKSRPSEYKGYMVVCIEGENLEIQLSYKDGPHPMKATIPGG
jgi:hypothetical protein